MIYGTQIEHGSHGYDWIIPCVMIGSWFCTCSGYIHDPNSYYFNIFQWEFQDPEMHVLRYVSIIFQATHCWDIPGNIGW